MGSELRKHWICDRCSREDDRRSDAAAPTGWGTIWIVHPVGASVTDKGKPYDLCADCKRRFESWFIKPSEDT